MKKIVMKIFQQFQPPVDQFMGTNYSTNERMVSVLDILYRNYFANERKINLCIN